MNIDQLRTRFPDENSCREFYESIIWENGRRCPHCDRAVMCITIHYLSQKRKASEGKDFLNSNKLYEPFRSCKLVTRLDELSGITKKDIIALSEEQKEILGGIVSQKMLKFSR